MSFIRLVWQLPAAVVFILLVAIIGSEYAVARPSRRVKDVAYVEPGTTGFDTDRHRLDVYSPRKASAVLRPVVVFIHGGNWDSGSKNIYTFIGRQLAKQGCVAVIINYRLAPNVQVSAMADDCAKAVLWTKQHITTYGGDPNRIFVMGHSAGGGLAALLATNNALFTKIGLSENPVKGAILDDPAGLDMYDYLKKMEYPNDEQYLVPYGKDPAVWRAMSPLYYVHKGIPPMLLYVGERTYPSIQNSSEKFRQRLTQDGVRHTFAVIPGKKHVGMVLQLYWKSNRIYQDLLNFVKVDSES